MTLAVPEQSRLQSSVFALQPYRLDDFATIWHTAETADILVPCGDTLRRFPQLCQLDCPIVIDGYDPYPVETVALVVDKSTSEQIALQQNFIEQLKLECLRGDFFVCASERQRYWWLGMLASHGRLNTFTYRADPTLRNLVDVVPYGCNAAPAHSKQVMKGVLPNIHTNDKVVLWGGGIWEWLDPLTLLSAFQKVVQQRSDVKLVFPGTRHPNSGVPEMQMRQRAIEMAQQLGLMDTTVLFGDWVAYQDWPNYLREADIGVSLHFNSLETQLAFRSRVLDYIGGDLPMIVSRGDVTSELVERYDLGLVVDCGDADAVAASIIALLDQPRETWRAQFELARADLAWERVTRPLVEFCRAPHKAADHMADTVALQPRSELGLMTQVDQLTHEREQLQQQIQQLQTRVDGYERGRFIRFMRNIQQLRRKVGA
ncbi:MAG: glycosyltransferase [Chloroflexi bacterium]|nr:glycosyltransferase [Chloroflexota bacterium]